MYRKLLTMLSIPLIALLISSCGDSSDSSVDGGGNKSNPAQWNEFEWNEGEWQ